MSVIRFKSEKEGCSTGFGLASHEPPKRPDGNSLFFYWQHWQPHEQLVPLQEGPQVQISHLQFSFPHLLISMISFFILFCF
jgi:hypothetical protein